MALPPLEKNARGLLDWRKPRETIWGLMRPPCRGNPKRRVWRFQGRSEEFGLTTAASEAVNGGAFTFVPRPSARFGGREPAPLPPVVAELRKTITKGDAMRIPLAGLDREQARKAQSRMTALQRRIDFGVHTQLRQEGDVWTLYAWGGERSTTKRKRKGEAPAAPPA
jgi:hypothetical protein